MRLSFVLELLLVFLFLAFAAARVIDQKDARTAKAKKEKRQGPPNRYCACTADMCNCCRDFSLPVVPLKGPGCASLQYLKGDNMLVSMSFGDRVLANTTVTGRKPKPICMGLPGGISQFCGRVYGISREGEHFKACLGLELRALDDIEAALRVSCFKFGPKGVNLEAAPPVPSDEKKEEEDDDDYDDYGFGGLGDDEDDDDDDDEEEDDDESEETAAASQSNNEVDTDDSADYTGFSVLGEEILSGLFGDDDGGNKKKKKKIKTAKPEVTTTRRPLLPISRPTIRPNKVTNRPLINRVTRRPIKDQQGRPSAPVTVVIPSENVMSSTVTASPSLTTSTTFAPSTSENNAKESFNITSTEPSTTTTAIPITQKPAQSDPALPMVDVAKVEALAAIAQQEDAAPMLVRTTTSKPEQPPVAEMLKNANSVEAEDEDDLLDGMLGEVASMVADDKPKKIPSKTTDKTKKGDLPSSSINSKPTKKPTDDEDPISFLTSVVGGDDSEEDDTEEDDTAEEYDSESNENEPTGKPTKAGTNENTKNDSEEDDDPTSLFDTVISTIVSDDKEKKKPDSGASDESEEGDDDDDDLLSQVIGDDEEKPSGSKTPSKGGSDKNKNEDDILGDLDDEEYSEEEDEEEDSEQKPPRATIESTTASKVPDVKPEANLVDSSEAASVDIDDVTDYESEEEKITTSKPLNSTHSEETDSSESIDSSEKSSGDLKETQDEDESTDLEIEGDIGLGGDDEERQIKKIRQIVGEAKRGQAPANWSVFLRPMRKFQSEPAFGSARGDRSSRVHRRMNLERIA